MGAVHAHLVRDSIALLLFLTVKAHLHTVALPTSALPTGLFNYK